MAVHTPTPIQAAALPHLLTGRDVIGQARTGSGKTLAFVIPMLERIDEQQRHVQALILTPTRELAAQVAGVARETAAGRDVRVLLLTGGAALGPQRTALRSGVHVVTGTPGRVLELIASGDLALDRLRLLVLDEADEMLDRGFAPDVERIIARTNPQRQTALFSATVPDWVRDVAARHLRQPAHVQVDRGIQPVEHVIHTVYDVPDGGKAAVLRALLDVPDAGVTLVFGRTKHGVKRLATQLQAAGYPAVALQGNLSQNARERVMAAFRNGETSILVATNVAARGLDVAHVARVINYELPESAALLTHRVGRTGRMGRAGEAITLLSREDEPAWRKLSRELARHPHRRPWSGRHEPHRHHPAPAARVTPQPPAATPPARHMPFGGGRITGSGRAITPAAPFGMAVPARPAADAGAPSPPGRRRSRRRRPARPLAP